MPLKQPGPHWHYLNRLDWHSPSLALRGIRRCSTSSFPKSSGRTWPSFLDVLRGHWCMISTYVMLVPKLHCTVSAAAETNYCQGANYILMRPAVTEASTVLLQAGVLVCRQVLLDLEIGARYTTGTKETLSGYRPQTPKAIFSPSCFADYFPGRLVLLQSNLDRHGKVNNLWQQRPFLSPQLYQEDLFRNTHVVSSQVFQSHGVTKLASKSLWGFSFANFALKSPKEACWPLACFPLSQDLDQLYLHTHFPCCLLPISNLSQSNPLASPTAPCCPHPSPQHTPYEE